MKKLLVVAFVLALLSCGDGGGVTVIINNAPSKTFWAQRITNGIFYRLDAELLAENSRCEIWVEKDSGVTVAQAQSVANVYSSKIYQKMIDVFSIKINVQEAGKIFNTIEFAHWVATGETSGGKITILLLDIKDGYVKGSNDAFVAGYYWPYDIYTNVPLGYRTNQRAMLYMDINPLPVGEEIFYRTIAHEMQHLMNFATSLVNRVDGNTAYVMDTWIDEGLSSAAEWVYLDKPLEDRIRDFNESKLIAKGNNFFVWDNREDEDPNAVLDDYATVYLFFQWLRLQTGSTAIYKDIITSTNYDYNAITENTAGISSSWQSLLQTWLRANYYRSSNDSYGYMSDTALNNIKVHYAPALTPAEIDLYPGEGVYSYVDSTYPVPSSAGNNIRYVNVKGPSFTTIDSGGVLLTYNVSTNIKGNKESGEITGFAGPSSNIIVSGGRSALSGVPSGPFPISAGDMLRRRGYEYDRNFPGMNSLKFFEEAVDDE